MALAQRATREFLRQRDDFDRDVWCVLGLPIDIATVASAAEIVREAVDRDERLSFVTPNVNWMVRALKEPVARRQIIDADLSLADGAPLVAIARALGAPAPERAAGADLFDALRHSAPRGRRPIRVFFFGGRDGAAEAAAAALATDTLGLEPCGFLNPGYGDVASMSGEAVIAEINRSGADFVVVALGAAKGQAWIDANARRLRASAIAHLGAAVDFTAGSVERAPRAVSRAGLEWAWRIKAEPSLWRRYAGDAVDLARIVACNVLPQALFAGDAQTGEAASAEIMFRGDGVVVRLGGDLLAGGLDPVRRSLRAAAAIGMSARLDFQGVGAFDGAFLGLVLMLEKHINRRGGAVEIVNISSRGARIFRANALPYRIAIAPHQRRSAGRALPSPAY